MADKVSSGLNQGSDDVGHRGRELKLFFKLGKSFLGKVGENGASGILVILTVSMEELASFFIFECPCDSHHFEYGLSYLLGT